MSAALGLLTRFGLTKTTSSGGSAYTRFRLRVTKIAANYGDVGGYVDVAELELLDDSTNLAITLGGTPSSTSEFSATYSAEKAFDGNGATRWISQVTPAYPEALGFVFGTPQEVNKYAIRSYYAANAPADWTLEGSNDGINWDQLDARVHESFGVRQRREFSL